MPTTTIISGKEVTFRDKVPAGKAWDAVMALLSALAPYAGEKGEIKGQNLFPVIRELGWENAEQLIQAIVESWEFDGDPSDEAAIANLDVMTEALPLYLEVFNHIGRETADLGEAESGSTSE